MPNGRVSLAFDDGYASTRSIALPRLSPYRMPASCYVIVDILGDEEQLKLEDPMRCATSTTGRSPATR